MTEQRDDLATKKDLNELKQELVAKIAANAAKIDANGEKIEANAAKIEANGAKIDANTEKIEANGAKIDDVEKRLSAKIDANSAALTRVSQRVVENSEKIDQLLTLSEKFKEYFHEIISTLDGLAAGFTRLDQERMVANARFDRVEKDVDRNKADIKRIKTKLAMP